MSTPPLRYAAPESFASHCLKDFLTRLSRLDPHPTVLDLGVLCGGNIAFLGARGCRVSVESLPSATRPAPPPAKSLADTKPIRVPYGVRQVKPPAVIPAMPEPAATVAEASSPLNYPVRSFSGVLAWDAISRMPAQEAIGFVESLRKLLDEGGVILAYFPGPPGHVGGSAGRYRIISEDQVALETAIGRHAAPPAYQNREIYGLFSRFEVIRLSQLKSGTREVLVAKSRKT